MKNITNKFLMFSLVLFSLMSCTKNNLEPSKPTFWVDIKIKDPINQVLVVGDTYNETGAVVTENGVPVDYDTDGSVDTETVGVYPVTYSAVNKDGIAATATKYVFVLPSTPASGIDLSGKYVRAVNNRSTTVTKILDGVYFQSDMWATATSSGNPFPVGAYFFTVDGTNLIVPEWMTAFGAPVLGTGTVTTTGLTFTIKLVGLTNNVTRIWVKQ
jgi:hypothetical protein